MDPDSRGNTVSPEGCNMTVVAYKTKTQVLGIGPRTEKYLTYSRPVHAVDSFPHTVLPRPALSASSAPHLGTKKEWNF